MSEADRKSTEELAYLLWERQGRPAHSSMQHWLEAEYRAHTGAGPRSSNPAQSEVDLRSRGLGPLTQSSPEPEERPVVPTKMSASVDSNPLILPILIFAGMVLGLVAVFFRVRKRA